MTSSSVEINHSKNECINWETSKGKANKSDSGGYMNSADHESMK